MSFEDIILELKLKPELWSTTHSLYKNRIIKQKVWKELSLKLRIEEDVLKKRWKHLKDQYRKELKKQPVLRSGAETETWVSTWQYFYTMSFMKTEVTRASSTGNLTVNETESRHNTENTQTDTDIFDSVSSPGSYHEQSPAGSSNCQPSSTSIRKRSENIRKRRIKDDMLEIEKKQSMVMEKRLKDSQQDENLKNDEDFLFFRSILPTLKKLNELQKLRFRGKINEWLIEACTENERALYQNQLSSLP
ncbi:uncharacterized protein LOC143912125 [Arctopsyche grandis]|uniref:uncharacterized protein LOC143912125 n=1 Tax=Arctopsyche grandis TaxID=121162 RepID=UPI00406D7DE9